MQHKWTMLDLNENDAHLKYFPQLYQGHNVVWNENQQLCFFLIQKVNVNLCSLWVVDVPKAKKKQLTVGVVVDVYIVL